MAIYLDELGRVVHRPTVETQGLAGRFFVRRTPVGDDADTVTVLGGAPAEIDSPDGPTLVVSCARFGAIPDDWDSAVVTADLEEFVREYTEMSPEARGRFHAEQVAESVRASLTAKRQREEEAEAERQKLATAIAKAIKEEA